MRPTRLVSHWRWSGWGRVHACQHLNNRWIRCGSNEPNPEPPTGRQPDRVPIVDQFLIDVRHGLPRVTGLLRLLPPLLLLVAAVAAVAGRLILAVVRVRAARRVADLPARLLVG